jgi:hypothetical protein
VLACIDARVDPAAAFGLEIGDGHVLRSAGGRAADDATRSMPISSWLLTRESRLCVTPTGGMTKFTDHVVRDMIRDGAGVEVEMDFLSSADPQEGTRQDVDTIRAETGFPEGLGRVRPRLRRADRPRPPGGAADPGGPSGLRGFDRRTPRSRRPTVVATRERRGAGS